MRSLQLLQKPQQWNVINMTEKWTLLNNIGAKRRIFNPKDIADLKELSYFKKHYSWKNGCPFILEWPYQDIVSMCHNKYTDFMLGKLTK